MTFGVETTDKVEDNSKWSERCLGTGFNYFSVGTSCVF